MNPLRATFREVPPPSPGVRRFVLDCAHGTTTGDLIGTTINESDALNVLVARHLVAEGCRCAATLRPRMAEARA